MAEDHYGVLGVSRNASQADIQKAYRELARKYHPDLNPDDNAAKKKFQQVQAAFDVLNDPSKREMYDRYGSAFEAAGGGGARPGPTWGRGSAEDIDFSQFFGERFGGQPGEGFADIFEQFTRGRGGSGSRRGRAREPEGGVDIESEVEIPFSLSVTGGEVKLGVPREGGPSTSLSVKIPAGIEDGKKIRLRGQGEAPPGGTPGDLLVKVRVAPHPYYYRKENNLHVRVPVTFLEAAAGAKIDVPGPHGTVSVRVPAGSTTDTRLRVKGQGIKSRAGEAGDLFVELQVAVPTRLNEESLELVRQLDTQNPLQPRRDLRW